MHHDPRKRYQCTATFALAMFLVIYMVMVAVADDTPDSDYVTQGLISMQFKIITGLVAIIQVLIGFIYISGINSVKSSMRKLFERIDHLEEVKLSKDDHDRLCDK